MFSPLEVGQVSLSRFVLIKTCEGVESWENVTLLSPFNICSYKKEEYLKGPEEKCFLYYF